MTTHESTSSIAVWLRDTLKRTLPGLLVMAGCLGVMAIWQMSHRKPALEAVVPFEPNVNVLVVRPETVDDTLELPGVAEPWAVTRLSAEVSGRVESITAREGDAIRAGQPLVYLETDLYEAEANRARAQVEFDQQELLTMQAAHSQKVATELELDRARSVYDKSKADLETAEVRLRRAVIRAPQTLLGQARTPATDPSAAPPIIGTLNSLPVKEGMLVQPGNPLCVAEIVDIRDLKVVVQVPESDVQYVQLDAPGARRPTVFIQSLDNRQVEGAVTFLSPMADPQSRTFRAEITVPNPQGDIPAGMIVKVLLLRQRLEDAVMAPLWAVIPLEGNEYEVYVASDNVAHRRRVKFGLLQGDLAQLLNADDPDQPALRAGEELILNPHSVGDGQKVRIQRDAQSLLNQTTQPATGPAATH